MSTTLTAAGFEGGAAGELITTADAPSFDGVSTAGVTYDGTHARNTLAAKCAAAAASTRGMWWSSTSMGGNQGTIFGRLYVFFTAAPPALARLAQLQSGGSVLAGVCLNTSRNVTVRNVKSGSTPSGGTSTTVLATNTWHRIEYSAVMSATDTHITVRIFAGANVDGTTPDETLTTSGMALAATADSVMHGVAFSSAQTWTVWLDDLKMQVGSGATWIGPTTVTPPAPGVNPGNLGLVYDMNADPKTGPRGLPSLLKPYAAAKSDWGFTAPEHITSGHYADGTYYVQLKMQKYASNPGFDHWFGPGDYGCRFHYDDAGVTSIQSGRVEWVEEWTGGKKIKTSMMGWFDRGTIVNPIDNFKPPTWPTAGERDKLEQWETTIGGLLSLHKGPLTYTTVNGKQKSHHPIRQFQWKGVDTSKPTRFRVDFTPTKMTASYQKSDGTWQVIGTETDPTFWQPGRGYHIEGALAYSQQVSNGASTNDPQRGNATRKISNLKVWSGTDPGTGGGPSTTDNTAPSPNPPAAPSGVPDVTTTGVLVSLSQCTDSQSGVNFYEVDRAEDNAGSPNLATLVTFTPITELSFFDGNVDQGDKVYYRERCVDQAGNTTSSSPWSSMVTVPTITTDPPICVGAVAPADGSTDAGDAATVLTTAPSVIFTAPATIGATAIQIEVNDGTGTVLSLDPADGATDPNTGAILYTFPPGIAATYAPLFRAVNVVGPAKSTVIVNVAAPATDPDTPGGTTGSIATPAPRDVWTLPGAPAYRQGHPVANAIYLALGLHQASSKPTIVEWQGVKYCVASGEAGPTPTEVHGGGNDPSAPDDELFGNIFDDKF